MTSFNIVINPQYVKLTSEKELFPNGKECYLHGIQKKIKLDFDKLSEISIITAPTGTGKSYAFPFPILNSLKQKNTFDKDSIRGLIVLPTNALIEELFSNYNTTYPQLNIKKITGSTLNEYSVKGFNRWEKILDLCRGDTNLVITNPDIINYSMHGGYHKNSWKKTGRKDFYNFLECFQYIIFDEFHLYDESQIANILTLIRLRDVFLNKNNKIKFLFVSATPERELIEILENCGYKVQEYIEKIISTSKNTRVIHGEIDVEISSIFDFNLLKEKCIDELNINLKLKRKTLIILNKLNEVFLLSEELQNVYPTSKIYKSTGYSSSNECQQNFIKEADIIIATNKAEVGVNYEVEYCIMQPGKYYQNFVQRFGRIARGDKRGRIVICFDNYTYRRISKDFIEGENISYYQFINRLKKTLKTKNFYSELVPLYFGEYLWCISNNLFNQKGAYNTSKVFIERLNEEDFFKEPIAKERFVLFSKINQSINNLQKKYPKGHIALRWKEWWNDYIDTFLNFRDASLIVQIKDNSQNIDLKYSLDWILQYKEILRIETIQKDNYSILKYTVGELKERDRDLLYQVSTIPNINTINLISFKEIFNLTKVFTNSLTEIEKKNRKNPNEIAKEQNDLIKLLHRLSITFNRKRLHITNIQSDNNFL